MKQITINGRSILLVEVPEGAKSFFLYRGCLYFKVQKNKDNILLPTTNWRLLFIDPLRPTNKELAEFMEYGTSLIKLWNHIVTSNGFTPGKVVGMIDKK